MKPLENLRQSRLKKLKEIKKLGIDPYPAKVVGREEIGESREKKLGSEVEVAGRIVGWREHGGIIFADLKDESGQIQLVLREGKLSTLNSRLSTLLDIGDFIAARGKLFKTEAGELSIEVADIGLLSKSLRPLPEKHEGLKDVETRYRQRYLDLIVNPRVKEVFLKRAQVVENLRTFLSQNNFLEVETPVLQPIYGGASARPFVTHHNALNCDFYLRISDELYLKRLIVGGLEKVYEIGKDFRNEGIDRQHNPEFTMLEFYWAYADYEDLMKFTEEMLSAVVKNVTGSSKVVYDGVEVDFSPSWERLTFRDLILHDTGIDIDAAGTEAELLRAIESKGVKLDLEGAAGYAAVLDEFYKKVSRPKIKGPTFITDHPYKMRPLAKRKADDPSKVASFSVLVKGFELINAYNELNDPLDQRVRWEEEMKLARKGLAEHQVLDEDYLRALEYGMPPTAGWGMGIDRFVALITNQPSIKDVILFPTLRPK